MGQNHPLLPPKNTIEKGAGQEALSWFSLPFRSLWPVFDLRVKIQQGGCKHDI
jgi:hypothetical protein